MKPQVILCESIGVYGWTLVRSYGDAADAMLMICKLSQLNQLICCSFFVSINHTPERPGSRTLCTTHARTRTPIHNNYNPVMPQQLATQAHAIVVCVLFLHLFLPQSRLMLDRKMRFSRYQSRCVPASAWCTVQEKDSQFPTIVLREVLCSVGLPRSI